MAEIQETLMQWGHNFYNNSINMFEGMTIIKYIRLIAIVGAYIMIRPYIMKLGEKLQTKQHEKELDPDEMAEMEKQAKLSPNYLRGAGGKNVSFDESGDEDGEGEGKATGGDVKWGKKAKRRQRHTIEKLLEEKEKALYDAQGEEDDKDILEYLVDYEEGKDGW